MGTGLSTDSDALLRWSDNNGNPQMTRLSPSAAAADGSSATLIIPGYANGAYSLQLFGSITQPLLQIVPTLERIDIQDRTVLFGSGFVEGTGDYAFSGAAVADSAALGNDIDVSSDDAFQNASAYLNRDALPAYGAGNVSVSTAGGTSAPLLLNAMRVPVEGTNLGDVAIDPRAAGSGAIWVSDMANPTWLRRIDPANGQTLQTIALSNANFGSQYMGNYAGPQILGSGMTLGTTPVAAGSLLVFNGNPGPDRVTALDPATGSVIASLVLGVNHDLVGGTYDPGSGHLFVTANSNQIVEIDPASGAQLAVITPPFNVQSWAGITTEPATGHLWLGAVNGGPRLVEYRIDATGVLTELRRIDTRSQGVDQTRSPA